MYLYLHCCLFSEPQIIEKTLEDDLYMVIKEVIDDDCIFALPKLSYGVGEDIVLLHNQNELLVDGMNIYVEDYIFNTQKWCCFDEMFDCFKRKNHKKFFKDCKEACVCDEYTANKKPLDELLLILKKYNIVDPFYEKILNKVSQEIFSYNDYIFYKYCLPCHIYYTPPDYCNILRISDYYHLEYNYSNFYYYLDRYLNCGVKLRIKQLTFSETGPFLDTIIYPRENLRTTAFANTYSFVNLKYKCYLNDK